MNVLGPEQAVVLSQRTGHGPVAGSLAVPAPAVTSDRTNAEVLQIFTQHRHLISLPVLEDGHPIGLISRHIFMSQMSKPYYRELYEKKSCIAFMDKEPLIADASMSIESLAALAVVSGDKTLADGFVITDQGHYVGMGAGLDLMRMMVDQQTEKNRQIIQSIDYASTIQRAMLNVSQKAMDDSLGSRAALCWQPRDLVGGDFYHFSTYADGWFAAVADCTGHGVPGAFLTLIASSSLNHALSRHGPRDPARLLAEVSLGLKAALGQHEAADSTAGGDGMDAAFLWFETASRSLTSAQARMPIFLLDRANGDVHVQEGERMGLGYADTPSDWAWRNHQHQLPPASVLCCCTDGLIDQLGGARRIAFGKRRLKQLLSTHGQGEMADLNTAIMQAHEAYQGNERRRDDLTLFNLCLD